MNFLSICSGIEAASVAWGPLGWQCVGVSEIEKFPSAVLAHHYPDVPNLGDFTKIDTASLGTVDVLVGGTPCQAFSVAGKRQSLADERDNLSLEYVRLAHELAANNGLRNAVWENVPGVLNTKDNAFGCFLAGLVGADQPLFPDDKRGRWPDAGMVIGPKGRVAWRVLDAQYFGLAQRRRRVFVVADFGEGADPAAVLFEPKSLSGNTPPRRETRKDVAPTISARPTGGGGLGTDFDLDGGLVEYAIQAGALRENPASGPDGVGVQERIAYTLEARAEMQAVAIGVTGEVSHALKAEGADASEDGTGRGTPIVAFSAKDYGADAAEDIAPTLRAGGHADSHANAGVMPAVAVALRGREGGGTAELGGEVATALRASGGGGDKPHVLTNVVRRLTPRECERLQGFPDDYTRIPWRGKPAENCPDGPRYKALGNSMPVPVMRWIGERIDALLRVGSVVFDTSTLSE